MKLKAILNMISEVRIINPQTFKETDPIRDTDVIRVYHGFSSHAADYAPIFARYGFSGKVRASRTYSYEYGNNPKGLFVTIDPKVAMDFGGSGYVMEFHTKVADLEAPVWNSDNGGYFVQGQYTKGFEDDDAREKRRASDREKYRKAASPPVAYSDRPELAFWILDGGERQALFTGDLNANMIRAFWVNDTLIKDRRTNGPWKRLTRQEFIKQYPVEKRIYVKSYSKGEPTPEYPEAYHDAKNKLFKPNDDFSLATILKKYGESEEQLLDVMINYQSDYDLSRMMYPKQIKQFRDKYGYKK